MTEHDDVIDSLRRARPEDLPDELVSPTAPAAQALLQEILSMDTTHPTEIEAATNGHEVPLTRRRRPRRRLVAVGSVVAAAAAIVAAVVATSILTPVQPSEAATIDKALARSAAALSSSGRAEIVRRDEFEGRQPGEWLPFISPDSFYEWEFSGDNWSVTFGDLVNGQKQPLGPDFPINRWVDGELYLYIDSSSHPGSYRWYHNTHEDPRTDPLRFDPEKLLGELEPTGDFEELGRQDIDGVSTRHLRATNPEEMPTPDLGDGMDEDMGHLTKLELWLDDEGLIRRIDATFLDPDALTHVDSPDERWDTKTDVAIRFFDFGAPITIAAPSDWEDLSPEG